MSNIQNRTFLFWSHICNKHPNLTCLFCRTYAISIKILPYCLACTCTTRTKISLSCSTCTYAKSTKISLSCSACTYVTPKISFLLFCLHICDKYQNITFLLCLQKCDKYPNIIFLFNLHICDYQNCSVSHLWDKYQSCTGLFCSLIRDKYQNLTCWFCLHIRDHGWQSVECETGGSAKTSKRLISGFAYRIRKR